VKLARRLLANTWVVEDLDQLPPGFLGVAVTRTGRAWFGFTRELRQAPRGGSERVLAERNRRDALVGESERAVQAEQGALVAVEAAVVAVQAADATRDQADRALRDADRARAQAVEEQRRAAWLIDERRKEP
jgi:chromosome segregation protein